MDSIELTETSADDVNFTRLTSHFVAHFAAMADSSFVKVIQIDNWFGERWLGFAGKILGLAGVRNRSLNAVLPAPPFRPSRIISVYDFNRNRDKPGFTRQVGSFACLHAEKNGGVFWNMYGVGLFCWYSGNTKANTTGSMMFYEVGRQGHNAWYMSFDKRDTWSFTKSRNISPNECIRIVNDYRDQCSASRHAVWGDRSQALLLADRFEEIGNPLAAKIRSWVTLSSGVEAFIIELDPAKVIPVREAVTKEWIQHCESRYASFENYDDFAG